MAKIKGLPDNEPPRHDVQSEDRQEFLKDLKSTPANVPVVPKKRHPARKIPVSVDSESGAVPAGAKPQLEQVLATPPSEPPTNMRTFQRSGRKPFPWAWVIGGLGVLAVAAVAGFFVFNRAQRFSGERVQLRIDAPTETASGSDITLTLNYQNLEPVDLVRAEVVVEYPEGFTIQDTSRPASNQFQNSFELGTIKSGRAGSVTIQGLLFGSVGTERAFSATLTFRAENFSSDFQTTGSAKVKITSSILELKLEGPNKISPGASETWTVSYTNTADRDLGNVQIEALYPDGFSPTAVEPAAVERSALWRFDQVAKGSEGKISITATANGDVGDSLELIVRAGLVTSSNTNDLQAEQKMLIILINSGVTASVAVNGATENSVVEPGETLRYSIQVKNDGEIELQDVTVVVELDGSALDVSTFDKLSKAIVEDQQLTWTKDQVIALGLLKPGQDVMIRFEVDSLSPLTVESDDDMNPMITAKVRVTSPSLSTPTDAPPTTTFTTKLATRFGFKAEARYADDQGVTLGSGPVPPNVGKTTSYRIFWRITNTTSEATAMKVKAELPTGVFWTGQHVSRDAGDVKFDATSRTVTWTLNKVPAGTGGRLPVLTATFEVSITPTAAQEGSVVVLCQTATATAKDSFSGRDLEVTQPTLTTDVPTDPVAGGEGEVQA